MKAASHLVPRLELEKSSILVPAESQIIAVVPIDLQEIRPARLQSPAISELRDIEIISLRQ